MSAEQGRQQHTDFAPGSLSPPEFQPPYQIFSASFISGDRLNTRQFGLPEAALAGFTPIISSMTATASPIVFGKYEAQSEQSNCLSRPQLMHLCGAKILTIYSVINVLYLLRCK